MPEEVSLTFTTTTAQWAVVMVVAIVVTVVTAVWAVKTWLSWMVANVEGAGRKVFVGIHGRTNNAVVCPHPLDEERTTFFISPLVRPFAYVNPDRDEIRLKVPFAPEGAPATEGGDEAIVTLRVSWSVPAWVPFYDIPGEPGDHGKLPNKLLVEPCRVPGQIVERFERRRIPEMFPVPYDYFVPGAAVIAFMNKYTEGEHLERMREFIVQHTREFLGSFHVRELMRVEEEEQLGNEVQRLHYTRARILGHDVDFSDADPNDLAHYVPCEYRNMGQLLSVQSYFLTKASQLELEPYGIFINNVTVLPIQLPRRLVEASRGKEARRDEVASMNRFTEGLRANVQKLRDENVGMDPDIAGLIVADSISTESRPGILGVMLALLKQWRKES